MRSLIHSHSSLVRSLGYIFSFIHLFYTTNEGFSDSLSGDPSVGARLCTAVSDSWLQRVSDCYLGPFWPLDAARAAPGQRAKTEAAVDATARTALRSSYQVVPASAH